MSQKVGKRLSQGTAAFGLAMMLAGSAGSGSTSPTFQRDIAPIIFRYCASCHRSGESAPFPLLSYEDARKRAGQIAAVTHSRYMPPWLPAEGYGHFTDELRLSQKQIELIQDWAATGAREGAGADAPPLPAFTPGWQLGPPDLVVEIPKPFDVPPDGPDIFWNFVVSPGVHTTRYIRAVEIRPGNPRAVHHANLLVDRARSGRQQEATPGAGFPGMDVDIETETFDPDSHFLFWKPGSAPDIQPAGMAWRLDPGNDLVLNVHFHPTGKTEQVRPSIGLYFTEQPQTQFPMLLQIEHDSALNIAPGARDFLVSDDFRLPLDVDIIAVYPHAHYLGTLLEGFATRPDGSRQWLIRIPKWDLNWQGVYRYQQPVPLPKGTVISMRFHYDNSSQNPRNPSSPPRRVMGGNQATDEMGHLWLQVLPRGKGDQRAVLQEALMRHRLENDSGNFGAHFNLGVLLLSRKETAAAIPHIRDALRIQPKQPMALNDMGAALEAEGHMDQAMTYFQQALQYRPDYASARYNLANTLAAQGKLEGAAGEFRRVLAAAPEDSAARDHLIAVLIRAANAAIAEGRLDAAGASYRELVSLRPGDPDLRNNYGILLARSGDFASAARQFEMALNLNPNHAAARRNLEAVQHELVQH